MINKIKSISPGKKTAMTSVIYEFDKGSYEINGYILLAILAR